MQENEQPTDAENQANDVAEDDFVTDDQQSLEETEGEQEKQEEFVNQEAVNKRINAITFEKYKEKRKREKLESELAELRAKIEKQEAEKEDIKIPDMPDVYDSDFEQRVREREDAIRRAAEIQAEKKLRKDREQKELTRKMETYQKQVLEKVDAMYTKAKKYGISKDDMEQAERIVAGFTNNNSDLAAFLIGQDEAPLIVKYLSESAVELEKIQGMHPLQASVYITNEVTPKATKLKPGLTQTPDPVELPKGKARSKVNPFLKGVQLE